MHCDSCHQKMFAWIMCVYVCVHVHMCLCICVSLYVSVSVYVCLCVCVCVLACTSTENENSQSGQILIMTRRQPSKSNIRVLKLLLCFALSPLCLHVSRPTVNQFWILSSKSSGSLLLSLMHEHPCECSRQETQIE